MNLSPHSTTVRRANLPRLLTLSCVCLATFGYTACSPGEGPADDAGISAARSTTEEDTADQRPVILLTGFEPFGRKRSPNSSWEGIAALDGREWKDYRLVSRKMRVAWGAPLKQLEAWIEEFQPVAIFSFGQGLNGAFALESRATNRRGSATDNQGDAAPQPTIVAEGPLQYEATTDCRRLASALKEKGYPVRVSTNAGQYLCEETLYTLEYLKAAGRIEKTVLFCHVPSLNSQLDGKPVDAGVVQKFVEDVLQTWFTVYDGSDDGPAEEEPRRPASLETSPPADDPRRAEVEEMIQRYFRTWSKQDMEGYGACFRDKAVVQFIDSNGGLATIDLAPFLASQRASHQRARHPQVEVPESIDIEFEQDLARVVVYWKLTSGSRKDYGYDHFTLMKFRGKWQIVNLVFYVTKSGE